MITNDNLLTTNNWLVNTVRALEASGIGTARLDCLILLEDMTGKDRGWLLAHPETKLTGKQQSKLANQIDKRIKHTPLAYVRGKSEFYGREFIINEFVLEPRPESETMIGLLKTLPDNATIIDVGTGSGALAITAKLEIPDADVFATDIDRNCLKIAVQNAKKHNVNVSFYEGDLLKALPKNKFGSSSALLCNLPYVPDNYHINDAAMMEPKLAIFGGSDGLELYRQLFGQIRNKKQANNPKFVLTESLPFQHQELAKIAKHAGYELRKTDDFIQLFQR
ncbi:MAG TPA: peptide chain release factor N(5)-glutamine methyltransferase [Patescibacteria group bacterium]|nr:peptide chain release factor N(5)-glutamine methyltransferase [Patescibacteria group bacterium]